MSVVLSYQDWYFVNMISGNGKRIALQQMGGGWSLYVRGNNPRGLGSRLVSECTANLWVATGRLK